jgi:Family of unknown function (DUF5675)
MMNDWLLRTTAYRADGIFSELYNGQDLFCVTLEHAYPNDASWLPKIPRGSTYTCVRGMHSLEHYNSGFTFATFEVTGVTGHSGILFHPGNFNKDSNGCILTGKQLMQDGADWYISHSQETFANFLKALEGIDEFQLRVE